MNIFLRGETGAVTVDWVVLTAGLVGLGLAAMAVVSTGVQDTSEDIRDQLRSDRIIQASFAPDLLAHLQTMYGINGGSLDGATSDYDDFQSLLVTGDEAALTAELASVNNDQAMFVSLRAMARAQYDTNGNLDFDALSAEYAAYGRSYSAVGLENGFDNDFEGDFDRYFESYDNAISVSDAKEWHLERALL